MDWRRGGAGGDIHFEFFEFTSGPGKPEATDLPWQEKGMWEMAKLRFNVDVVSKGLGPGGERKRAGHGGGCMVSTTAP